MKEPMNEPMNEPMSEPMNEPANEPMINPCLEGCPISYALSIISRKWTLAILCSLSRQRVMRYGELKRAIPEINNMMLSQTLKELEKEGLLSRVQYNEMPLRVEYSLTAQGEVIFPLMNGLADWGYLQMEKNGAEVRCGRHCPHEKAPYYRAEQLANYPLLCDDAYMKIFRAVAYSEEYNSLTGLEKLKLYNTQVLFVLTQEDGFVQQVMSFYTRKDTSPLLERDRVYYECSRELIRCGRLDGSITTDLDDESICVAISRLDTGIVVEWALEKEESDVIADNQQILDWFYRSLS